MLKKISSMRPVLTLFLLVALLSPTVSYASNFEDSIEPKENYTYAWQLISITKTGESFGPWRVGPTGLGPGELSVNDSVTLNRSFTNTISGSYSWGVSSISAATGITIGKSLTYGTSYKITLPSGKRRTIIIRPKIANYKVVTGYYRLPVNVYGDSKLIKTETSYISKFIDWDYSWREGY